MYYFYGKINLGHICLLYGGLGKSIMGGSTVQTFFIYVIDNPYFRIFP